jgi:phosphoribosylglycinamide formyltransferase-1
VVVLVSGGGSILQALIDASADPGYGVRIVAVGSDVLSRYTVLNSHPALLPSFPGTRAVADALEHGVTVTGVTIHLVDAGMDTGPIVAQRAVPVRPADDEESLHERIKVVERDLVVRTVHRVLTRGAQTNNREVLLP